MIQFNLLPDVKLEFIKAERTKHAVVSGAVIVTGATFLIFALLFSTVHVVQKKIISDQTSSINDYVQQLKSTPDLDKILTIQNQLTALPGLHAGKPAAARTFSLIQQITPSSVSLTGVTVDFEAKTISIDGKAKTLSDMNTMVDTVKYASYAIGDSNDTKKAFSDVVLATVTRNSDGSTFTITANYDDAIYDNANDVKFSVPSGISTSSIIDQPTFTSNKQDSGQ